ncbi:hypothetical protein GCM10009841_13370 [Microlunatus panaciterrae]
MLVPLETLPGWPVAENPSFVQEWGLLIGIPALICVVIILLAKAPTLARASRKSPVAVQETLWLGAGSTEAKALEGTAGPREVGGASARW